MKGNRSQFSPRGFRSGRSSARGAMYVEVLAAAVVALAAFALVVQLAVFVLHQRRAGDHRQIALQEAANILENFAARPWDDVTPETARTIALSSAADEQLQDAELNVEITDQPANEGNGRRISVAIRWREGTQGVGGPVRLVAYRFP
jgi:hypothetical protein